MPANPKGHHDKRFIKIIFQSGILPLCHISEREAEFFRLYLTEDLTLEEIGKRYDLTRERVRQIYTSSLRKLERNISVFFTIHQRLRNGLAERGMPVKPDKIELKKLTTEFLQTPLANLGLNVRTLNVMNENKIFTLAELLRYNKSDLLRLKNFGKKSLTDLEEMVRFYNLQFGINYLPAS
jgi:predicted DNA-binding protein YlxM (UPF0122 family)